SDQPISGGGPDRSYQLVSGVIGKTRLAVAGHDRDVNDDRTVIARQRREMDGMLPVGHRRDALPRIPPKKLAGRSEQDDSNAKPQGTRANIWTRGSVSLRARMSPWRAHRRDSFARVLKPKGSSGTRGSESLRWRRRTPPAGGPAIRPGQRALRK